jgi:hypothetical protein
MGCVDRKIKGEHKFETSISSLPKRSESLKKKINEAGISRRVN